MIVFKHQIQSKIEFIEDEYIVEYNNNQEVLKYTHNKVML